MSDLFQKSHRSEASLRGQRRGEEPRRSERRSQDVSAQTPRVKAPPTTSPLQNTSKRPPSSSPRPPAFKPLTTTSTATSQPIKPLSPRQMPDPPPAEVMEPSQPDWLRVTGKDEVLRLATRHLSLDPASTEGINFHISSSFFTKLLKRGDVFMFTSRDHHLDFARKGSELGVSAKDLCIPKPKRELKQSEAIHRLHVLSATLILSKNTRVAKTRLNRLRIGQTFLNLTQIRLKMG